jgi:hypothetical protein
MKGRLLHIATFKMETIKVCSLSFYITQEITIFDHISFLYYARIFNQF